MQWSVRDPLGESSGQGEGYRTTTCSGQSEIHWERAQVKVRDITTYHHVQWSVRDPLGESSGQGEGYRTTTCSGQSEIHWERAQVKVRDITTYHHVQWSVRDPLGKSSGQGEGYHYVPPRAVVTQRSTGRELRSR